MMDESLNLSDFLYFENEPASMNDSLNLSTEIACQASSIPAANASHLHDQAIAKTTAITAVTCETMPAIDLHDCSSEGSLYIPEEPSSSSYDDYPKTSTPQKRNKKKKKDTCVRQARKSKKKNEESKPSKEKKSQIRRGIRKRACASKRVSVKRTKSKNGESMVRINNNDEDDHGMRRAMMESAKEAEREQAENEEHYKRISEILESRNMELKIVPKDGNCFLAASIAQVPSCQLTALQLRSKLCDMMLDHQDELTDFLNYDSEDKNQRQALFRKDVSDLRKDGSWNSELADILPLVASNFFERPLTVFTSSLQGDPEICIASDDPCEQGKGRLYYTYLCIPGKEHYDYCIPKRVNSNTEIQDVNNQTASEQEGEMQDSFSQPNMSTSAEGSDTQGVEQVVMRGRKRRRESAWKCNIQKRKRNAGMEHISRSGRKVRAKTMRSGCGAKCKRQCHYKVSQMQREKIFHEFWQLGSATLRNHFVAQHTSKTAVKRRRNRYKATPELSRKKTSLQYSFKIDHHDVVVCKTFFLHTLDISDKMVMNVHHNTTAHGTLLSDRRGTHDNHQQANSSLVESVRDHIRSFQSVPSHYCRKHSTRQYLPSHLNLKEMYRLYIQKCQLNQTEPAKEHLYKKVFYTDFNLSFHVPKKDVCSVCEKFRNSTHNEKDDMRPQYERHQRNKDESRQLKQDHKEKARTDDTFEAACFDMQQVLQCPSGNNSLFFYKRKLDVYNLSVYSLSNGAASCYMWDETVAKRGSSEVSSCILHYLREKAAEGKESVALYADNCGGQNKNRFFVAMMIYAVQSTSISKLAILFLEKGHTQNENDSTHATIEHAKRKTEVFSPLQYFSLVRGAKKSGPPLRVIEVAQRDVYDFKELCKCLRNCSTDENREPIRWREIRQIAVSSDRPEHVYFCYNHDEQYREFNVFGRSRQHHQNIGSVTLRQLYCNPLPVTKAKYDDLQSLCSARAVPTFYHEFYTKLPVSPVDTNDSFQCQCSDVEDS